MYKVFYFIIGILLISDTCVAQNIGINTTNPHASAMLDILSTQKGLLIPRMEKVEREIIANPPAGLVVFQTDGQAGFYYYEQFTASWKIIGTANMLIDEDSDTKIQVEKNPDEDIIRIDIAGTEKLNLQRNINNLSRLEFVNNDGNIIVGDSAGYNTNIGSGNIAYGNTALYHNTDGDDNIAFGNKALFTSRQNGNIALGNETMIRDSIFVPGSIAIGNKAGKSIIGNYSVTIGNEAASLQFGGGDYQIAIGVGSLKQSNTTWKNIGIGHEALANAYNSSVVSQNPFSNIGIGYRALLSNVGGSNNIGIGAESNSIGFDNIGIGYKSLNANTKDNIIGIGSGALQSNNSDDNISIGYKTLSNLNNGNHSTGMGSNALVEVSNTSDNTAFGANAMINGTGYGNTSIGYNSMSFPGNTVYQSFALGALAMSTGTGDYYNSAIGYNSNIASGAKRAIAIGANAYAGTSNCIILGSVAGINGATTTSQVGIGTSSPHESAILDVTSSDKVFSLNSGIFNSIVNPPEGLMLHDQNTNSPYYFNGTSWKKMYKDLTNFNGELGKTLVYKNNLWEPGYMNKIKIIDLPYKATVEDSPDDDAFKVFLPNTSTTTEERFVMKENVFGQLILEFPNNSKNILIGQTELLSGQENVVLGQISGLNNGSFNTGLGNFLFPADIDNTISIGHSNLQNSYNSSDNIAIGDSALNNITVLSSENIGIGFGVDEAKELTKFNTAIGSKIDIQNYVQYSTAIGHYSYLSENNRIILGAIPGHNGSTNYSATGIGITDPNAGLHIKGASTPSNPQILLEEDGNVPARLVIRNESLNKEWEFLGDPDPNINTSSFTLGYNNGSGFKLFGNGDLLINGTLSDNSDSILKKILS
ncbi:MAG: hypothetical protein IPO92_07170 [Saprospiraceae bacterium]|nr:hypothetical protein [Saprospiraceae bacterium]